MRAYRVWLRATDDGLRRLSPDATDDVIVAQFATRGDAERYGRSKYGWTPAEVAFWLGASYVGQTMGEHGCGEREAWDRCYRVEAVEL